MLIDNWTENFTVPISVVVTDNAFIDPLLCISVCDGNLEIIVILLNNVCFELEYF